jgi:hypothetical protein
MRSGDEADDSNDPSSCLDPAHRLDYKTITMRLKKRQTIGTTLMVVSVLIQAFSGRVLSFQSGPTEVVSPNAFETSGVISFNWRYVVPLAAGFFIGLIYCTWPARKPPRLPRGSSAA